MALYSCQPLGGGKYSVSKISDEAKDCRKYKLFPSRRGILTCECEGYNRHFKCRHQTIVSRFQAANKAPGALHDYEKNQWLMIIEHEA